MKILEIIKPKENIKEFIEEKLKEAIKEITPYKKPAYERPRITVGSKLCHTINNPISFSKNHIQVYRPFPIKEVFTILNKNAQSVLTQLYIVYRLEDLLRIYFHMKRSYTHLPLAKAID